MTVITGILLATGSARRFGAPKLLLLLQLLQHDSLPVAAALHMR